MLAAELVVTIISTFISPGLYTSAMLQIVLPFSFIHCAIYMLINPRTVCFVVRPEAIIDVSINVDELAFPMSAIFPPLSNVLGPVRPGLLAETITETTFPLASVNCPSFELVGRSLLPGLVGFVNAFRHRLPRFFLGEVFGRAHLL